MAFSENPGRTQKLQSIAYKGAARQNAPAPLLFFEVVRADSHFAERLAVFVGQLQLDFAVFSVAVVRAKPDLQTQLQFDFVPGLAQSFDGVGDFERAFDGAVDGSA